MARIRSPWGAHAAAGGVELGLEGSPLSHGVVLLLSVFGDRGSELVAPVHEAGSFVADPAGGGHLVDGSGLAVGAGEFAALGDGGPVGPVVVQDGFEHVAGVFEVVGRSTYRWLSCRPRVAPTYRPRRVVAGETSWSPMSTVSPWLPCSVAA